MPPRADTFLSQDGHDPCPDLTAPAGIPVIELHRRLDVIAEIYAWYCRDLARVIWAKQSDTVGMCQKLTLLDEQLDKLRLACEHAQAHARLLFDLSFNEGERRGVHRKG